MTEDCAKAEYVRADYVSTDGMKADGMKADCMKAGRMKADCMKADRMKVNCMEMDCMTDVYVIQKRKNEMQAAGFIDKISPAAVFYGNIMNFRRK